MTDSNDESPQEGHGESILRRLRHTPRANRLFVAVMTLASVAVTYGGLALLVFAAYHIELIKHSSVLGASRFSIVASLIGAVVFAMIYTILTAVGWAERQTVWKTRVFRPLWIKNLFFAMITALTALPALDDLIHGLTLHWANVILDPEVRLLGPVLYLCAAFASLNFAESLLRSRGWRRDGVAKLYGAVIFVVGAVVGALFALGAAGIL